MKKEKGRFKVHVIYRSRDDHERRYMVNSKLAGIINLEENMRAHTVV